MSSAKDLALVAMRRAGLVVTRPRSSDPWHLIARLLADRPAPVVFDIGANTGQTIARCRGRVPSAQIYAFEPSPATFAALRHAVAREPGVEAVNVAVGERRGTLTLLENSSSDMSSFLRPGPSGWGSVVTETPVDVVSVDEFTLERGIEHIDVLKSDTQGFDLDVFRGAAATLERGAVSLVMTELTFTRMYDGMPRFDEVLGHLLDRDFRVVGMYVTHQDGCAAWADAVLAHAGTGGDGADSGAEPIRPP